MKAAIIVTAGFAVLVGAFAATQNYLNNQWQKHSRAIECIHAELTEQEYNVVKEYEGLDMSYAEAVREYNELEKLGDEIAEYERICEKLNN